ITSYHTGPALWLAIHSALKQAALKELILVDNGNPPQVVEKIHALEDKRLVLLTGHGNVGFAKGCNLGAAAATGDYLLFLNPDCLLPDNALQELSAAYEQAGAMLAGCLLKNPDGSEQRGGRREIITPLNA